MRLQISNRSNYQSFFGAEGETIINCSPSRNSPSTRLLCDEKMQIPPTHKVVNKFVSYFVLEIGEDSNF